MFADLRATIDEFTTLQLRTRIAIFRWSLKVCQYAALILVLLLARAVLFAVERGNFSIGGIDLLDVSLLLYFGPALVLCFFLLPISRTMRVVGSTLTDDVRNPVLRHENAIFLAIVLLGAFVWVGAQWLSLHY